MRILSLLAWALVAGLSAITLSISGTYLYLRPAFPSLESLRDTSLQTPLRIYSQDRKFIAEFGEVRRYPIGLETVPDNLVNALLAAEDDSFRVHSGVDVMSLFRAFYELIRSGAIQSGGSTITMQVAKNYLLTHERSFSRKAIEILLALQIERVLSKDEILELYINKIFLGHRAYGVEAAAWVYYGKSIGDLDLAQHAMIAGLPKAPSRYNPLVNPERAKLRRDWILSRMLKLGSIDEAAYQAAVNAPLSARLHHQVAELSAPYIAEMARAEMVKHYGSDAYTAGFDVYLTVPSELQTVADKAVRDGLMAYDRRHGYRGPEDRYEDIDADQWLSKLSGVSDVGGLEPAVVSSVSRQHVCVITRDGRQHAIAWASMRWARPYKGINRLGPPPQSPSDVVTVGDLIRVLRDDRDRYVFAQVPIAQSALVSIDPNDGAIRALVGGFSFERSKYNRASQAKRQSGSSFKPFLYSAALDRGFTAATLINDAPIIYQPPGAGKPWRPRNSNRTFLGPIPLREGLYKSRNLVSIRLLQAIGIDYAAQYLTRFGFEQAQIPRQLSLALGTVEATPLQIASAWSVFANNGYKVEPYLIERVENRDGETVFLANPASVARARHSEEQGGISPWPFDKQPNTAQKVIDSRTAYIMTDILRDAIVRGTGRGALVLNRPDIAGKTGTTNDAKDSWFSGFNGDYVTTVWSGFDEPRTLGRREYGSTVSLPIWVDYMGKALAGKPPYMAPEPENIVKQRVDPLTGRVALSDAEGSYFELFKSDSVPGGSPDREPPNSEQTQSPSVPPDEDLMLLF